MKPTPDQLQTDLDGLAALTAVHGLVLDVQDPFGAMCLDSPPAGDPSIRGYAGVILTAETEEVCSIAPYHVGMEHPDWRIRSTDISRLSAHQRLELESALARERAILRGEA